MKYIWANPAQIGVIKIRNGVPFYIDSGQEYDEAIAGGPAPYAGPLDIIAPDDDFSDQFESELEE